jgi:hypothetical protein
MCERKEAQRAQNAAADALTIACIECRDQVGASLALAYAAAVAEAVPQQITELLERLR